jgi:hypothetical protein
MYMPKYTYQIEGGLKHTWRVDNVIETANAKNELVFTDRQKKKQKCILAMMRLLMNEIKQRDIKLFAISGTLLGAKRNKGLIPYDDDGDFGFTMTEYNKLKELSRSFSHPEYKLYAALDCGFRMVNKGSYIAHLDLFAMGIDEDQDKIVHISPIMDEKPTFYTQYIFPKDWMDISCIETLEWCDFEDFRIPCPTNAEEQLKHMYSPNCLTTFVPDKRNVSGLDTHEVLHYIEPIGCKTMELFEYLNQNIPAQLQPKDRRGYFTVLFSRFAFEMTNIDFETSTAAKKQRMQRILDDYMKYKGILI